MNHTQILFISQDPIEPNKRIPMADGINCVCVYGFHLFLLNGPLKWSFITSISYQPIPIYTVTHSYTRLLHWV